jgi:hypothetical protein
LLELLTPLSGSPLCVGKWKPAEEGISLNTATIVVQQAMSRQCVRALHEIALLSGNTLESAYVKGMFQLYAPRDLTATMLP